MLQKNASDIGVGHRKKPCLVPHSHHDEYPHGNATAAFWLAYTWTKNTQRSVTWLIEDTMCTVCLTVKLLSQASVHVSHCMAQDVLCICLLQDWCWFNWSVEMDFFLCSAVMCVINSENMHICLHCEWIYCTCLCRCTCVYIHLVVYLIMVGQRQRF